MCAVWFDDGTKQHVKRDKEKIKLLKYTVGEKTGELQHVKLPSDNKWNKKRAEHFRGHEEARANNTTDETQVLEAQQD